MSFKKKICFIHVPKCGGSTIHTSIKSVGGLFFSLWHSYKIDSVKSMRYARNQGLDVGTYRSEILQKKLRSNQLQYVTGHAPCSSEIRSQFEDQWAFLTILRDPVERFISEHFFNRHKKADHVKHDLEMAQYLEAEEKKPQNHRGLGSYYVRYFATEEYLGTTEAISSAIENLCDFQLVGFLDEIESFAIRFQEQFGKSINLNRKKNENPVSRAQMAAAVSDELRQRIAKICEPDLAVYTAVKRQRA